MVILESLCLIAGKIELGDDLFANWALFVLHLDSLSQEAVPAALVMTALSHGIIYYIFTTD